MDPKTQAQVAFWVAQYAAASEKLRQASARTGLRLLRLFDEWYVATAVASFAAQAARISQSGRQHSVGLARTYVANVVATMRDTPVHLPPIELDPIRNGADMLAVYTRPAEQYRLAYAHTGEPDAALAAATDRLTSLIETDLQLTGRDAEVKELTALKITGYRRVLHPELSAGGSCGLCFAASTRVYHVAELMPMHNRCKCTVAPVIGSADPGAVLNREDLDKLYAAAGGTSARKLTQVRYKVNEHGEYGPVLTRRGDEFRGPADLGKNDPIGRAKRELDVLRPVLTLLESKRARGVDVSGPLQYQRERIAKLESIIAAAA